MTRTKITVPTGGTGIPRTLWRILVLACFAIAALSAAIISLMKGAINIPAAEVMQSAFGRGTGINSQVIWNIRLPRTLVGGLVGMNLAMAGAVLQSVRSNDIKMRPASGGQPADHPHQRAMNAVAVKYHKG